MRRLVSVVCCLFVSVVFSLAQQEDIRFQNLLSIISVSENGGFTFALVPNQSVDHYFKELKVGWEKAGDSKEQMARKQNEVLPLLEREKELRSKYKQSGLYKTGSSEPVRRIASFPKEIDTIYVANDGSYVVGFNADIVISEINPNVSIRDLLSRSQQIGIIALHFEDEDTRQCSINVRELEIENAINRRTHSLVWADRERAHLNTGDDYLEIEKLNGEKIVFDVSNCGLIVRDRQQSLEQNAGTDNARTSYCFGIVFLTFLLAGLSCRL